MKSSRCFFFSEGDEGSGAEVDRLSNVNYIAALDSSDNVAITLELSPAALSMATPFRTE